MDKRMLIKIETKEVLFSVEYTPNSPHNDYSVHFQRNYGNWMGSCFGMDSKETEDIKIIDEAFNLFIQSGYIITEINIVKGYIDKLKTPQLELF